MLLVNCLLNTDELTFCTSELIQFFADFSSERPQKQKTVHAQHCRHCYHAEQTEGGLLACWIQACVSKLLQQPCVSMRAQTLIWVLLVEIWLDRGTEMRCSNLYSTQPCSCFSRTMQALTLPELCRPFSIRSIFRHFLGRHLVPVCLLLNMPETCSLFIRSSLKQ